MNALGKKRGETVKKILALALILILGAVAVEAKFYKTEIKEYTIPLLRNGVEVGTARIFQTITDKTGEHNTITVTVKNVAGNQRNYFAYIENMEGVAKKLSNPVASARYKKQIGNAIALRSSKSTVIQGKMQMNLADFTSIVVYDKSLYGWEAPSVIVGDISRATVNIVDVTKNTPTLQPREGPFSRMSRTSGFNAR